jgi:hypothetical protein
MINVTARLWGLAALFLPGAVLAFQPLVTDDAGTQGAGGNQIEYGYVRVVDKDPVTKSTTSAHALVYTRGLTETLDAALAVAYLQYRDTAAATAGSGAANPVAGLKWRFYEDEGKRLSLALKPEVRVAVSGGAENSRLDSGKTNARIALLLTREADFGSLHANLVLASNRYAEPDNRAAYRGSLWRLSVAPVFELSPAWKIALDAGLVTNPQKGERAAMGYLELGAIYTVAKGVDLALGIARDVGHQGHSAQLATAGLTWQFR